MRKRQPVWFVVLVGLALVALWRTIDTPVRRQASGQPKLAVPTKVRIVGDVSAGQELRIPFVVRNVGTRRLVINEISPDCNCGPRKRPTTLIPAGGSAQLSVTLSTQGVSGPVTAVGAFTTSDPEQRKLQLKVHGRVVSDRPQAGKAPLDKSVLIKHHPADR